MVVVSAISRTEQYNDVLWTLSTMVVGHADRCGCFMSAAIIEGVVPRVLPRLTPENRPFWTGGSSGHLLIQKCQSCSRWVHPPTDRCPACEGLLVPEPVSGRGTLFAFTVNHYQFHPDVPPPNMIGLVQLVEQADIRLPANMVNCEPEDLQCGLPVQVLFERQGEIFVPLFEPIRSQA
jgi:uncharacterized OB-fold protein